LIGTYSSIAVAAPMLVAYQDWRTKRAGQAVARSMSAGAKSRDKIKVKA
jgi:preprotein translocase subunit SecF